MNKILFLLAAFLLTGAANQMSAQLIIRNSGHAELGVKPSSNDLDTLTMLKIFGPIGDKKAAARITFGDSAYVAIGELGNTDSDRMWLHGKNGLYLTAGPNAEDTIMYYDINNISVLKFNKDVHTSGVFVRSDERFKENVEPVSDVLSSLEALEAVSYTLKNDHAQKNLSAIADMPVFDEKSRQDKAHFEQCYTEQAKGSERYGFLAQNVKEVFPQLVHTDNSGYMYVDYIGLIPILVQSINELRAELAAVKGEAQEEDNTPMMLSPQQSAQNELEAGLGAAKLYQNAPNPWNSETVIRYSLPENVGQAFIYIYDMQGAQLMSLPANGRGESQVTLTARDLKAGMYLYALVADGTLIDSKQMILTK